MAYLGRQPTIGNFLKLDTITTSATATYNLLNGGVAYSPQSPNHCIVSLNGVIQSPTTSFTISGSTIVFASALTSNDVIDFILVLGDVLNIGTPSDATVGFAKVTSNLITGATAETSIAGGDSILIYDDSATALRKMTRTNFIGGGNTPAFKAGRSSSQTIANGTNTIIVFGAEDFDTDSAYDTATGTFTVPSNKAGKYFLYAQYRWQETAIYSSNIEIHKNGSQIAHFGGGNNSSYNSNSIGIVLDLSVADAITIKAFQDSGTNKSITGDANYTYFLGYKLI